MVSRALAAFLAAIITFPALAQKSPLSGVVEVLYDDGPNFLQSLGAPRKNTQSYFEHDARYPSNWVNQAFKEFQNPALAMRTLEGLKGPKKGGKVVFNIQLIEDVGPEDNQSDQIAFSCGSVDADGKGAFHNTIFERGVTTNITKNPMGDLGDQERLETASPATMVRNIATCLSRLPGMPALKVARRKAAPAKWYADAGAIAGAYHWLSSFPKMGSFGSGDQAFRKTMACIMHNAANRVPNARGDHVIMRTLRKGNPARDTFYLAFADDQEAKKLTKVKSADAEELIGPWPSGLHWDFQGLMGGVLGDSTNQVVRACALASGLNVPYPNISFPLSSDCITTWPARADQLIDYMKAQCEADEPQGCLGWAGEALKHVGKCGEECRTLLKGRNMGKEAETALKRACELKDPAGCYAYANFHDQRSHVGPREEARWGRARGCALAPIEGCAYYRHNLPLPPQDERQFKSTEAACEAQAKWSMSWESPCPVVGVHWWLKGDKDKFRKAMSKVCVDSRPGMYQEGVCSLLAEDLLEQGKVKEGLTVFERACTMFSPGGCVEFARYWEKKGNAKKAEEYYQKACRDGGTDDRTSGCLEKALFWQKQGREEDFQKIVAALCKNELEPRREEICAMVKGGK